MLAIFNMYYKQLEQRKQVIIINIYLAYVVVKMSPQTAGFLTNTAFMRSHGFFINNNF